MKTAHIEAIDNLTVLADEARNRASSSDRFARDHWNDYRRHSENAREAWRRHGELLQAIKALEDS